MKTIRSGMIILMGFALALSSCNQGPGGTRAETKEATELKITDGTQIPVNTEKSRIEWTGSKPTGNHHGTVMIREGYVTVKNGEINGGEFVIDLQTIVNEDLDDPDMNAQLVGHLKSSDFFHVDSFPVATFVITRVEKKDDIPGVEGEFKSTHLITGNLTMKGIIRGISFPGRVYREGEIYVGETNSFTIDRTAWGVNYGSQKIFDNLKDQFIYDEMGLKISIVTD
ncbi:MAG: YceI family protein [Bacteroidales bacterium]